MAAPSVYSAISAITAEFSSAGIPKTRVNEADGYTYRSIDDLLDRLAPLLAKHRLCVLPRTLKRQTRTVADGQGGTLLHVALRVSYVLTSADDGSSHSVEVYGEALDAGDKASAKALSAAFKSALIQTFCIPVTGDEDADRSSPKVALSHDPEPPQGWDQWSADIREIIASCDTEQAIETVRRRQRRLLLSLSREKPELYQQIGTTCASHTAALAAKAASSSGGRAEQGGKVPAKRRMRKGVVGA